MLTWPNRVFLVVPRPFLGREGVSDDERFEVSLCTEIETEASDLIESRYVVRHDDYVVSNRYAWAKRGKHKVMLQRV